TIGGAAAHPRGGATQAEYPAERDGGVASHRGQSWSGAGEAEWAGARRTRLDRHEMPGEGPQSPLRDCQRPGAGSPALFGGRTSASLSTIGGLPLSQVRPAESDGASTYDCGGPGDPIGGWYPWLDGVGPGGAASVAGMGGGPGAGRGAGAL